MIFEVMYGDKSADRLLGGDQQLNDDAACSEKSFEKYSHLREFLARFKSHSAILVLAYTVVLILYAGIIFKGYEESICAKRDHAHVDDVFPCNSSHITRGLYSYEG